MAVDVGALAQSAVELAKPVLIGAAGSAAKEAGISAWGWIKAKLTNAGQTRVVEDVERNPNKSGEWLMVTAHLVKLLENEPGLADELAKLLKASGTEDSQVAVNSGDNARIVNVKGKNNTVITG